MIDSKANNKFKPSKLFARLAGGEIVAKLEVVVNLQAFPITPCQKENNKIHPDGS